MLRTSFTLAGWMASLGRLTAGKESQGEELGELVNGLQIPQHVQSESTKTHPIKGLETCQGLSVDKTHIKAFQWAEDRGIRRWR